MTKPNKGTNTIHLTLDRFEEESAVLLDENDEKIIIPRDFLPKDALDGSAIVATFATDEAHTRSQERKAKEILNEILNLN